MKRSWLIQRLKAPRKFQSPFAFGAGLINGGLSKEAIEVCNQVFSFDYMGAAEFEWGAVPEAMQGLAKDAVLLRTTQFSIGDMPIYVLGRIDDLPEIEKRILQDAAGKLELKESTMLKYALKSSMKQPERTVGWLELDNGFFFFTDRTMWANTCSLFDVKVPTE